MLASAAFGASAAELCSVSFDQKSAMPTTQGGYNLTWSYTQNNKEWTIVNFNHNSGNWAADGYIKAIGKKTTNATATISTGFAVSGTATEVIVKAKKGVSSATGSLDILGSSSADFTNATKLGTVDLSKVSSTADDVKISLTGAKADMFYRLLLTASNSTKTNGAVWVYSITINGTPAVVDPDAIATPEISVAEGTESMIATITCDTEGATIYYTTDGTDPTESEAWPNMKYTQPFDMWEPGTIKAIAYKDGKASAIASKTVSTMVIGELASLSSLALADGQTISFICNNSNATVAYRNGNYLYIAVGSGFMTKYYQLFSYNTPEYAAGQKLTRIEGTYGFRYGQPQITNYTLTAGEVGTAPAPIEIDAISGYIEKYMVGAWYTIKGVNITSVSGLDATMVLPADAALEREEETVALRNTFGLTSFEAGENLTVSGFVGIYNETVQFLPTEILNEQGEKICALPVFNLADGAYSENIEITISCETEGATIVYTVNGGAEVEVPAPATLTLTEAMEISAYAKAEGYTNSDPVTASYTIKAEEPVTGTTATFDFSSAAEFAKITCTPAQNAYPNGNLQPLDEYELSSNGVSINFAKKEGTSNASGLFSSDNTLRVYTGNKVTFSINAAYTLKKITFTAGSVWAGFSATTVGTWDNTTKVWTAPETGVVTDLDLEATGTTRIAKIEVEFASASTGIEAIEAEDAAPAVYYNLQGVRVENPANGLYIRVNGKKAEKVFIR